jgi:general secretion pathway protein E
MGPLQRPEFPLDEFHSAEAIRFDHMLIPQIRDGSSLNKIAFLDMEKPCVYVSADHIYEPSVRSYLAQARGVKADIEVQQVSMEMIAEKKSKQAVETKREGNYERSEMQRDAYELFATAVKRKCSDIHIRVSKRGETRVFMRIHGDLVQVKDQPYEWGKTICATIYQAMTDVSASTYEMNSRQDARISRGEHLPQGVEGIRIATTPQVDGCVMVLRLLYNATNASTDICDLGFNQQQKDLFALMKGRPTGINIIAGPTGSGKSTTLQRTMLAIHQECRGSKHIITVEDPPEYPMPGIVQTPVADAQSEEERSIAFQSAIRASMRLDPNVIMIGEMRDKPSAKLAIQAAMTGHQVWATLHANNGLAIIDRMVDLEIPVSMMADPTIITGLICHRLVKVLCPHCKQRFTGVHPRYSPEDSKRIMGVVDIEVDHVHVMGNGCDSCMNTGIMGRTVVAEIVVPDHTLMTHIRRGDRDKAYAYWRTSGGRTMLDHAIDKIKQGLIDPFQAEDEVGQLNYSDASVGGVVE